MSLVIERHFIGNDECLSVSHYFEQNGDLIPDPDILFHSGEPVESFLRMKAKNIKEQGFLEKVKK